jgi:hypothetical protein
LLLFACSDRVDDSAVSAVDPKVDESIAVELVFEEEQLLTEQIMSCDGAVPLSAHQFLCQSEGQVWFVDEASSIHNWIGEHHSVTATATADSFLLVLDGELHRYDGHELSPIDVPIPVPIEFIRGSEDTVWMVGAGRLFRWVGDSVSEIAVEGIGNVLGVEATASRLFVRVPELIAVDLTGGAPEVTSVWDRPVTAMALDAQGDLWTVSEGELHRKQGDEEPLRISMPERVVNAVGPGIWVQGETASYRFHNGGFASHMLRAEGMFGVDDYGRMLQIREGELRRHSAGRPIVVAGLSDSLMVSETVTLLPSDPASLGALRVWVDDRPLALSEDPFRVTLNPEDLAEGEHRLRFFAESSKGDSMTEQSVWVGELSSVEWPSIQALSDQHCARCHGGETLTDLSTADGWERRIDSIIDVVTAQEMPLGGPYLNDEEIIMIRAWKHGGFQ